MYSKFVILSLSLSLPSKRCILTFIELERCANNLMLFVFSVVGKSQRIPKIISTRRPVTEEEKEKTLRSAKEFTSDKPFFQLKMTAAYVYDGLFLVRYFCPVLHYFEAIGCPYSNIKDT